MMNWSSRDARTEGRGRARLETGTDDRRGRVTGEFALVRMRGALRRLIDWFTEY